MASGVKYRFGKALIRSKTGQRHAQRDREDGNDDISGTSIALDVQWGSEAGVSGFGVGGTWVAREGGNSKGS